MTNEYLDYTHVREGDGTNLKGVHWGIYRVEKVSRDDLGRPVMVEIAADDYRDWVPADQLVNVRRVRRWAHDAPGSVAP